MNQPDESSAESPLALLISAGEVEELAALLFNADADGMLDIGELDGFLSALAVAPKSTTLDRWWTALLGQEAQWESPTQFARMRELVERYYAMVQARVSHPPFDLGVGSIPPLWSSVGDDEEDLDFEFDHADDAVEDEDEDEDEDEHALTAIFAVPEASDDADAMHALEAWAEDPRGAHDEDEDAIQMILSDDEVEDVLDDGELDDLGDEVDAGFDVAETWLSGFRYGLALQSDDWRRTIEAESTLAPWLNALWVAADGPADADPIDELASLPPTAAFPENAGFLALEANLRAQTTDGGATAALVEANLIHAIPVILHHLWRQHHDGGTDVAAAITDDINQGSVRQRDMLISDIGERLARIAEPAGGMNVESLDGYWSALCAGPGDGDESMSDFTKILGESPRFNDDDDMLETAELLSEYWQTLVARQQRKPDAHDEMCDVFVQFPAEEDVADLPNLPYGRDWAMGFLLALEDFPRSARLVLMDPEAKHSLGPIEALASGQSLEKRNSKLDLDERLGLILELPDCVWHLRGFWKATGSSTPPVRASKLPGRNDPCPCGSGKKYKKCHGAPDRLN